MLYLFVYLAGIVDSLRNFLEGFLIFIVPITIVSLGLELGVKINPDEWSDAFREQVPKFVKVITIICCITSFLYVCVPQKTVIYQLAGVYFGKQASQQLCVDKKLQKVSEIIDLQLDKGIRELRNDK